MKKLITNYSFDASAKTITFTDYTRIAREGLLLITNVTDNIIIYNFADSTAGGTVTNNVLMLTYNTTTMDDTDDLQIFYDDGLNQEVDVSQLEMLLRLLLANTAAPPWYQPVSNAIQALLLTGSTTAVTGTLTGVTTVAGLTNIGGVSAANGVYSLDGTGWANTIRSLLI